MRELRSMPFEFRAAKDADVPMSFEGYGSVFGTLDSYRDTIAKGAFKATLKEWKAKDKLPKMLLQHGGGGFFSQSADDMVPVGKWDEMREDDTGLWMRGHLFDSDTDRAKGTYAALKAGELDGLSIGFQASKWKFDEEQEVRTLTEIKLFEVSLVTFPANDPARITDVRADGWPTERRFEEILRDAGFTRQQAKAIVADGFEQWMRDAFCCSSEEARSISQHGFRQVRRDAKPSEEVCGDMPGLLESIRRLRPSA